MALGNEVVIANDPEENEPEVEEEEEEEEELVDPHDQIREDCKASAACQAYEEAMNRCTDRVERNPDGGEECTMELFDFLHCVDHCASHKLFSKLK